MKTRGYYLSFEAIVSLLLLGLLLAMPLQTRQPSLNDLHIFKKENDLLLLWAKQGSDLSLQRMAQDFKFAFPGKSGEMFLDGESIVIGGSSRESVASKAVFFDKGKKHEIRLVVFKPHFS